jgi:cell division septation protein DedD
MKEEQDDLARPKEQPLSGFNVAEREKAPPEEPVFDIFDEESDDTFEESDRDTDFSLGFREETFEEEEFLEEEEPANEKQSFDELLPDELEEDQAYLFEEQESFLKTEAQKVAGSVDADPEELWETSPVSEEIDLDEPWQPETNALEAETEEPLAEQDWEPTTGANQEEEINDYEENEPEVSWALNDDLATDRQQPWMAQDEYVEEDMESERWPISMLAVGTLALLLVIAGVYGVMQQRSATQEEIRQLRASLATAVSPEEVAASRTALQDANARNSRLASSLDSMRVENQRLADTVSGLEAQLAARQTTAAATKPAAPRAVENKPVAAKPAAPKSALPAVQQASTVSGGSTGGSWFVNFGSYGQESAAKSWAGKLKPSSGKVIVAPTTSNGRTYYRVRVIDVPNKSAAQQTARNLESTHGVSKLWVGQQ